MRWKDETVKYRIIIDDDDAGFDEGNPYTLHVYEDDDPTLAGESLLMVVGDDPREMMREAFERWQEVNPTV